MGAKFFESTLPRLTRALERIADGMGDKKEEKETKEPQLWARFSDPEIEEVLKFGPYAAIEFAGQAVIGLTKNGGQDLLAGRQMSTQGAPGFWWEIPRGKRYRTMLICVEK